MRYKRLTGVISLMIIGCMAVTACGGNTAEMGDAGEGIESAVTAEDEEDNTANATDMNDAERDSVSDTDQGQVELMVSRNSDAAITNTISDEIKEKAKNMPEASYDNLPVWRGTSIYNKYEYAWTGSEYLSDDFSEETVDEIADIGFDFVRVLLDTRFFYTEDISLGAGPHFTGNSDNVNTEELKNLDDLISWCVDKGIHVCLDVHNTPGGYMIGGDEEATRELLFTEGSDEEQMFFDFWEVIARRYKDISTNALSFNLYNEPPNFVEDEQYTEFVHNALDIIWGETPDRLIFVDMLKYAREPVYGLVGEKVVQSFHVYEPYEFSHANNYRLFECRDGGKVEIVPYPIPPVSSLLSSRDSYTIHGEFPQGTELTIMTAMGNVGGRLQVIADGNNVFEQEISEDFILQNGVEAVDNGGGGKMYSVYDYDGEEIEIQCELPDAAENVEFRYVCPPNVDEWFEANTLLVETDTYISRIHAVWVDGVDLPKTDVTIDNDGRYTLNWDYPEEYANGYDELETIFQKFVDFSNETQTPVIMMEMGDIVYTDTSATVRYFDDVISLCNKNDIGWTVYSHDGCEFSYVAVEDAFRRPFGTYEETSPGSDRYVCTELREIFQKHMD